MSRALAAASGLWRVLRSLGLRGALAKLRRRRRDEADYQRWLQARRTVPAAPRLGPTPGPPPQIELSGGPLISVLMPTCDSDLRWLGRAVESVRGQTYSHWELCIADDASTRSEVVEALASWSAVDPRIRFVQRRLRGHISAASNSALDLVRGEWLALLDHDDELAPDALEQVAEAVRRRADADLVYSDEDRLAPDGRRTDGHFKPDFSPDLLLSQNFVSHLGVYRTALVRQAGGFREGLEGAQDHDLALRVLELSAPGRVLHVPHVLYHWRTTPQSASGGLWRKAYAHDAGLRAICDHLARSGRDARVERALYSAYRVRWALPSPAPSVSVVVARDAADLQRRAPAGISFEVVPLPDGREPVAVALAEAVRRSRGEIVVLLGPGCAPQEGCLEELAAQAARPEVAVVGGKVLSRRRRVLHASYLLALDAEPPLLDAHAGARDAEPGPFGRANLVQNPTAVSAECMAFRREVYERAGGFDTQAFAQGLFDVDFCLRAAAQGRIVFTPYAKVVRSGSRSPRDGSAGERQRLRERWSERLPRDPCWHPEFDRTRPDFRLRP